jgi:hypothetical protein
VTGTPLDPPCDACDGTGIVCSDTGTATVPAGLHGTRLHPWDGESRRADACDHGGPMACPVCTFPPGEEPDIAPDVVDAAPDPAGSLVAARTPAEAMRRMIEEHRKVAPEAVAAAEAAVASMSPEGRDALAGELFREQRQPTGLDRVRDVVRRDRGEVTGAELAVRLAAMRARLIESRHLPPNTAILVPPGGGGLISDPDDRPRWRRQLDRLVSAVRGAFRR